MKTLLCWFSIAAALAQPRLQNAKMETRSASAGLEPQVRAILSATSSPSWIAYSVASVPGERNMCCYNSGCCAGCTLEGGRMTGTSGAAPGPVRLEGYGVVHILIRALNGQVDKIRTFSPDCELDAGGVPFYWLANVRPAQSVALLMSWVNAGRRDNNAIGAIALHAGSEADEALEKLVAAGQPEGIRERTTFWLGNARGRRGFETLRRIVQQDGSPRIREKAVFALTQSKEPEAVATVIEVARKDGTPNVRGQALFWLAQMAGRRATSTITDAVDNDPDTEVKKKAVFALYQLPREEGIPLLIGVARNNRNAAARKQAMHWLGQSKDPRALRFFEEILTK
ncbi:MAG: HEAT repeat domain-containing protein [Bryobacteraceae bacterium]